MRAILIGYYECYEHLLTFGTRIRMATPARKTSPVRQRKAPQQRRSADTVAAIVEAAARILETKGFEGFNTNAVAGSAGVSIGSLYQYFPGKHALLSALIQREMLPLLTAGAKLASVKDFRTALHLYVRASVRNQMRRPELARLIDLAEKQDIFHDQIKSTAAQLLAVMEEMLGRDDAPTVPDRRVAAGDTIAIMRALTDAAGERAEQASMQLVHRIENAVLGYLSTTTDRPLPVRGVAR